MKEYDPNEILYLCDPRMNQSCKKTSCFANYGPCKFTKHKEYAVTDEDGKPLGYTFAQYDNLTKHWKDKEWPSPEPIDDILDTLEHSSSGLVDE